MKQIKTLTLLLLVFAFSSCVKDPEVPIREFVIETTITNITANSAKCNCNIPDIIGALPVTARGVCWNTSPNPTIENNHTTDGSGTGAFTSSITGLTTNTTYYVKAYATNNKGTYYGEEQSFTTGEPTTIGEPFTDSRDGNTYNTINIGKQVWMVENLRYLPSVVGPGTSSNTSPYYYVYGYDGTDVNVAKVTTNYQTYGVLYNWEATLSACPAGWHLPSDAEWTELENFLANNGYNYDGSIGGGGSKIAKAMASTTGWNSSSNTGAVGNTDYSQYRNKSGFTALPGGYRYYDEGFDYIGDNGCWWSAGGGGVGYEWCRILYHNRGNVYRNYTKEEYGFSVRCVKD